MVDTLGLPVMITMTAGDVRDEIIARDLLWRLRLTHPQITQVWAFSAYARDLLPAWTADHLWLSLQPVLRPRGTRGFVVLPRRLRARFSPRSIHRQTALRFVSASGCEVPGRRSKGRGHGTNEVRQAGGEGRRIPRVRHRPDAGRPGPGLRQAHRRHVLARGHPGPAQGGGQGPAQLLQARVAAPVLPSGPRCGRRGERLPGHPRPGRHPGSRPGAVGQPGDGARRAGTRWDRHGLRPDRGHRGLHAAHLRTPRADARVGGAAARRTPPAARAGRADRPAPLPPHPEELLRRRRGDMHRPAHPPGLLPRRRRRPHHPETRPPGRHILRAPRGPHAVRAGEEDPQAPGQGPLQGPQDAGTGGQGQGVRAHHRVRRRRADHLGRPGRRIPAHPGQRQYGWPQVGDPALHRLPDAPPRQPRLRPGHQADIPPVGARRRQRHLLRRHRRHP
ncbi:hypothetical protein [Streptomyces sp. NPDC020607]|uniref:hypothetical protein n=1 Tax=Streptomyces sp. NPDC020607 TaxID=3365082 RepID=UPI0037AEB839